MRNFGTEEMIKIDYEAMVGVRFGRLVVMSIGHGGKAKMMNCACDCGNDASIAYSNLIRGNTKSCGCWRIEYGSIRGKSHFSHGKSSTRTYRAWISMRRRCSSSTHKDYQWYGARGITVCDRWLHSFENFLSDMGEVPTGQSLDRIDSNGNYEPGNCRWATNSQQQSNRRPFAHRALRKISFSVAQAIRYRKSVGDSWAEIAETFGVSKSAARRIVSGQTYRQR